MILNKLKLMIDVTTENNANIHTNWVVLCLYSQADLANFVVLIYQGNDPQADEQIIVA